VLATSAEILTRTETTHAKDVSPSQAQTQHSTTRIPQVRIARVFPLFPSFSYLFDKLPFVRWLIRYNARWLVSDIIAGLTVGLMVVPQGLAYASIANLPPRVSGFCS